MDIREIKWQQALPLRHQVLWPQKSPEFCKVNGDENAKHYGAYIEGVLVSVASVYIEEATTKQQNKGARLRKFATLAPHQGRGIGTALITFILNQLKQDDVAFFWCDARKTAVGFYQRFDMQVQGNEFDKSGVLYFKMQVQLNQILLCTIV
ncbi:N-acetyltransferase [Psychromonas marina]|uniref:N-acetyltransferase n=1 Tax=Psychromonas marina TaxID=88364 RepID=A0ABQ6E1E3_9GAMM|nr:GNAT family N-acetyltransferase [Psychromonas marina]GLS91025.1 N-acetyltransferase [Psychromonas marina]